jgi:hypothetical protein
MKKLVKRRIKNFTNLYNKCGIYIIAPYQSKTSDVDRSDAIVKVKVGLATNLGNRLFNYHTSFEHGTGILALIQIEKERGEGLNVYLRRVEQYYFKALRMNGFHQANHPSVWVRKERAEWFIGSYKLLKQVLNSIENSNDKFFKILHSEYFDLGPERDRNDSLREWTYRLYSVY